VTTIVLINPQIPQNTGNIARLCAATNTPLHIVGKIGFDLSDKYLKRAGLDYWDHVNWSYFEKIDPYIQNLPKSETFLFSAKTTTPYTQATYPQNPFLVFGAETTGIPENIKTQFQDRLYTIPMANPHVRCINLSTSVGIVLYEVIRQNDAQMVPGY